MRIRGIPDVASPSCLRAAIAALLKYPAGIIGQSGAYFPGNNLFVKLQKTRENKNPKKIPTKFLPELPTPVLRGSPSSSGGLRHPSSGGTRHPSSGGALPKDIPSRGGGDVGRGLHACRALSICNGTRPPASPVRCLLGFQKESNVCRASTAPQWGRHANTTKYLIMSPEQLFVAAGEV